MRGKLLDIIFNEKKKNRLNSWAGFSFNFAKTYNPGLNFQDTFTFLKSKTAQFFPLPHPLNNVGCQDSNMSQKSCSVYRLQHCLGGGGGGNKFLTSFFRPYYRQFSYLTKTDKNVNCP